MDYWPIIGLAGTLIFGVLAGKYGVQYTRAKRVISKVAKFIGTLDAAMTDDQVTEAEWQEIWAKLKEVLSA